MVKRRMARLLAAVVIFLSSLLAAQVSMAAPAMDPGIMVVSGHGSDMTDCGQGPAPACRIDCVLCHAVMSEGPLTAGVTAAYVTFASEIRPSPPGVLRALDPPIPRRPQLVDGSTTQPFRGSTPKERT